MSPTKNPLTKKQIYILYTLAECLICETDEFNLTDLQDRLLVQCSRFLGEMPLYQRWLVGLGLWLFEWLPCLSGFGFSRFTKLKNELKKNYVDQWASSSFGCKREFFRQIKTLVFLVYFSDQRVWSYLRYDPDRYMAERIGLRKDMTAP